MFMFFLQYAQANIWPIVGGLCRQNKKSFFFYALKSFGCNNGSGVGGGGVVKNKGKQKNAKKLLGGSATICISQETRCLPYAGF